MLTGLSFTEILTNSITNSAYFSEEQLKTIVRLMNNLSSELDVMRPSMLHTALEVISFNINRKNSDLRFFEFGKTYATKAVGQYEEKNHLCLYLTGQQTENHWKQKAQPVDIYYIKGVAEALFAAFGIQVSNFETFKNEELISGMAAQIDGEQLAVIGQVNTQLTGRFDIKQPVFYADFYWDVILKYAAKQVRFKEIPKFPAVERDLAIVVPKNMKYFEIKDQISKLRLNKLQTVKLFDVFESEKLGADKKSMAINLTFQDEEKTLTDKEIDSWMNKIMTTLEKELSAEIRK